MTQSLSLVDVIHRSMAFSTDDVVPLVKYLDMPGDTLVFPKGKSRESAERIANYLCEMGGNDLANFFRGGDGVPYDEIVVDVGGKLKAKRVSAARSVEENEEDILVKIFEDTLDKMSDDEKRQLFRSLNIDEGSIPFGATGAAIIQLILRQYGGFATYQIAVIVANVVSRALLGSGLTMATNVAVTRAVGFALGPIGWIVTGLWLAIDLAGPAYRKTVPAVVHIAMLRQMLKKRMIVGVVGDGSSGKDACIQAVFGLAGNIDPVAGSTAEAMVYPIGNKGNAYVVNYPGFNDYRARVNDHTDDYLHHTDVFIHVVDIIRGVSGTDVKILEQLRSFGRPVLICLNKVDLPRSETDLAKLRRAAEERLVGYTIIETAFDPDPRLSKGPIGCSEVRKWLVQQGVERGKDEDAIPILLAKGMA